MNFTTETLEPGYHKTNSKYHRKRASRAKTPLRERPMIAWDGEGMKLSGDSKPQHYVLFGCSAEPLSPLMIQDETDDLTFTRIIDYACAVSDRHPTAFHVGFFFTYDQNMIIKSLSAGKKVFLYEENYVRLVKGEVTYTVKWIPGKQIILGREENGKRSSIRIDDFASFFASSFVKAYSSLIPEGVDTVAFDKVVEGKANRAEMLWGDMDIVVEYWTYEIQLLADLAEKFKTVMYDAGFMLNEWYGPGALANYLRRTKGLTEHEWGGKEENLPPEVHDACKRGMFGGHVEQFLAGRIRGPIYCFDLRSAYPAAIAQLPSLRDGGSWRHVRKPTSGTIVGIYHVQYRNDDVIPWRPQPLPHRDSHDNTSYPGIVDGWYWTPEASLVYRKYGANIIEGYEWVPVDETERPWDFLNEIYVTRQQLKAEKNPTEMAFKLAMNSLYGKFAQRAGWDKKERKPPKSHTLPLAGWTTSFCRAGVMELIHQMDAKNVIAVETDGVFSTQPPDGLSITIGKGLGEWEVEVFDEIVYVQNGLYLARQGKEWKVKTRGMDASSITYPTVMAYLQSLKANEQWEPMEVPQGERFIGLGSAVSRSQVREQGGVVNRFRLGALHCKWFKIPRAMAPGLKGKRLHLSRFCPACQRGSSAASEGHRLIVRSMALKEPVSAPFRLPWERPEAWWRSRNQRNKSEISAENI